MSQFYIYLAYHSKTVTSYCDIKKNQKWTMGMDGILVFCWSFLYPLIEIVLFLPKMIHLRILDFRNNAFILTKPFQKRVTTVTVLWVTVIPKKVKDFPLKLWHFSLWKYDFVTIKSVTILDPLKVWHFSQSGQQVSHFCGYKALMSYP